MDDPEWHRRDETLIETKTALAEWLNRVHVIFNLCLIKDKARNDEGLYLANLNDTNGPGQPIIY